jgi:RND family efflux transporter MFP subunit
MKNITKLLALTTLIIITSCAKEKPATINNTPTVNIKVSTPITENNAFIAASGKIEAVQNANISTRLMGYVNTVKVNVGDKVKKGQLLLSINSADISAQKAQVDASIVEATVALTNAEKDFYRYKTLFSESSASQKEMDDMTANFEMAKARLEAAKQMRNQVNAQLSYSNIVAPFSGVITGKFINEGDMANPGMPLLSIETPGNFQVIAMVAESDITFITENSSVNVLVKSLNKILKGTVTEISTSAKNTGGQYLVKIILDKTTVKIMSGMFVTAQFPIENSATSTVLIPTSAIVSKGGLKGIYTVSEQNTAILRWLRFGKTYDDNIEVLSGLNADEQYIISADGKLFNGVNVAIQ